eukprot:4440864-Pleurochrysis_carterae.AAC.1
MGAAQTRGWGAPGRWLREAAGRDGHRERSSESLGSGARALRKYACDAMAKRKTVHVRLQLIKSARDDSL